MNDDVCEGPKYMICRRIEIDAGHRVPTHGSKCRNKHGHRYVIDVVVTRAGLVEQGEETGMVMDFGFIKQALMRCVHEPCDHTFLVWAKDDELIKQLFRGVSPAHVRESLKFAKQGAGVRMKDSVGDAIYITPEIPTAENLAKMWFDMLNKEMPEGVALVSVTVHETPNCIASFPC